MDISKWEKLGIETSMLGFGCMRFPMLENGEIDEVPAAEMLDKAYQSGITYFDTAYVYHKQKSEEFMARCLSKYPRESYTVATKLPVSMAQNLDGAKRIFNEQLARLKMDYVDFYMLHGIGKEEFNLAKDQGIIEYCEELKKEGKIKYFGFSFHDNFDAFEEIINYRDWDFCQIQLNYMDVLDQAGLKGYYLAEKLGIPVIIMEPVKGGSLATLSEDIAKELKKVNKDTSLSSWAFRWLANYPGNKVILSGMSSMEQLEDNIRTFTNFKPLNDEELNTIKIVKEKIEQRVKNGCTNCSYCMPCPVGVDIPKNFTIWNRYGMFENRPNIKFWWTAMFDEKTKAKNCVKCGKCEPKCPQKINIRKDLEVLQKELDDVSTETK